MDPFKNFSIWRGRLPHWRADDVRYYVTFRHRRALESAERLLLLRELLKPEGDKWDLLIVGVLPETTELLFTVREDKHGRPYELAAIVERAKSKAGKAIAKRSGETFPPFYSESYDRIVRDDAELEERWEAIFDGPVAHELCEDPETYEALWVAGQP
ncbi:MAG: hypothetical protein M9921_11875 [Fimbriimonadaceae bacterium]|nr:hypothetical protein [Fimbriimonadaceae bacterium]